MSILRVPLEKQKKNLTLAILPQRYIVVLFITFLKNSAIKQHLIIKHNNNTYRLTSSDVEKIFTDNTIIIYKKQ